MSSDNAAPTTEENEFNWKRELFLSIMRAVLLMAAVKIIQKYFWYPVEAASSSPYKCGWKAGQRAQLYVYLSKEPIQVKFDDSELAWKTDVTFVNGLEKATTHKHKFKLPMLTETEEYYAHVYLVKEGMLPESAGPLDISYRRVVIRQRQGPTNPAKVYTKLDLGILQTANDLERGMHPVMRRQLYLVKGKYAPVVYAYDDWRLKHYETAYVPEKEVEFVMTLQGLSWLKFQALVYFGESFRIQLSQMSVLAGELEQMKEMIMEANVWLLATTFIVSVLHSLFDFLAFKNDIAFWRGREDFGGMSVRAVLLNALFQIIIFLYLLDRGTSWLILGSVGTGLLIELWKVKKVVKVWKDAQGWHVEVKNAGTKTEEHDTQATWWLMILSIPLVLGYAVYSWKYETHPRTTYSYVLSTLVGFVYAFGFISMTPQLFINYRLKSVAHLPWRVFAYKALNTFIDDLFAFVVRMPMLHRVACFRDDFLFLIYLYQRWIYPTDMARTNEFGQSFKSDNDNNDKNDKNDKNDESIEDDKPVNDEAIDKSMIEGKPMIVRKRAGKKA